MAPTILATVFVLFFVTCSHGQDLASYENSKILVSGQYELYWTYRPASSMLEMAVRVKTLGWFGLGISPDGQMSNSDVAIGWVTAGGTAMLRVSCIRCIVVLCMHAHEVRMRRFRRLANMVKAKMLAPFLCKLTLLDCRITK